MGTDASDRKGSRARTCTATSLVPSLSRETETALAIYMRIETCGVRWLLFEFLVSASGALGSRARTCTATSLFRFNPIMFDWLLLEHSPVSFSRCPAHAPLPRWFASPRRIVYLHDLLRAALMIFYLAAARGSRMHRYLAGTFSIERVVALRLVYPLEPG